MCAPGICLPYGARMRQLYAVWDVLNSRKLRALKSALGNQDMHLKENFLQYYFSTVEIFKCITDVGKVF